MSPKEDIRGLYDRERELREVVDAIRLGERLVVVYGVRRVGKTSLVRVAVKEARTPHLLLDVRRVYFEEGAARRDAIYKAIAREFTRNMRLLEKLKFNIRESLGGSKGFMSASLESNMSPQPKPRSQSS